MVCFAQSGECVVIFSIFGFLHCAPDNNCANRGEGVYSDAIRFYIVFFFFFFSVRPSGSKDFVMSDIFASIPKHNFGSHNTLITDKGNASPLRQTLGREKSLWDGLPIAFLWLVPSSNWSTATLLPESAWQTWTHSDCIAFQQSRIANEIIFPSSKIFQMNLFSKIFRSPTCALSMNSWISSRGVIHPSGGRFKFSEI